MTIWNQILAAVDETDTSLAAVYYLAGVLAGSSTCRVHLLGVHQAPLDDAFPNEAERQAADHKKRKEIRDHLKLARVVLLQAGIHEDNVQIQMEEADGRTVAETILARQAQGGYGTVVVGRRNLSKAEEFLFGSVSSEVVHRAYHFSVWIVA